MSTDCGRHVAGSFPMGNRDVERGAFNETEDENRLHGIPSCGTSVDRTLAGSTQPIALRTQRIEEGPPQTFAKGVTSPPTTHTPTINPVYFRVQCGCQKRLRSGRSVAIKNLGQTLGGQQSFRPLQQLRRIGLLDTLAYSSAQSAESALEQEKQYLPLTLQKPLRSSSALNLASHLASVPSVVLRDGLPRRTPAATV
ncbi:MAG: hypothetical protein KatS3mg110_3002 [Pirellulaceae bacterium]|nr:MAG: hypothetical protein KatS3mg110_3002 [Pirellulaceae bacterium]